MSYYGPNRNDHFSIAAWIGLLLLMTALLIVGAFFIEWGTIFTRTHSPDTILRMSREANDKHTALEAARSQINVLKLRVDEYELSYGKERKDWPQGKRQEYEQDKRHFDNAVAAYNTLCADYKAMWQDEWREISLPPDLPRSCEMY